MPWMRRQLSFLAFLALVAICASLTAVSSELKKESTKKKVKIVSVTDQSVRLSGHIDVIYRGQPLPLEVDAKPVEWEPDFAAPVQVGHLHLSPGMHQLKIGDESVEFCVALNELEHDAPSEWQIHRTHTMSNDEDRCAECHKTEDRNGKIRVGLLDVPQRCMDCHEPDELAEPHQDFLEPLPKCNTCHALHGSPYEALLNAPEKLIREKYGAK